MRNKTLLALVLALPLVAFAGSNLQTVVLDMQNMTCSLCTITIKRALKKVPGVVGTQISYDRKTATVEFDPKKASPAALINATTDAGFPAKLHSAKP